MITVQRFIDLSETIIVSNNNFSKFFEYSYYLVKAPFIKSTSADNFYETFSRCENLIEAHLPLCTKSVENSFRETFYSCNNLKTLNISNYTKQTVDNIKNPYYVFPNSQLNNVYYNVEIEDKQTWALYSLKRTGASVILKKYNLANNTLIKEKVIDVGNSDYPVTLFYKTDELLIDRSGNITDRQINLLLNNKWEFGDKYTLDPSKKWLVMWADNPDNVRSNCFVTQKELQDLKAKLKKYHPDLF